MEDAINNIINPLLLDGQILLKISEDIRGNYIRIVIDSEIGITLNDTARLTKKLKKSRSFIDRYPDGCRLEVTTPGLNSSLKYPFQFKKNINRIINLYLKNKEMQESIQGRIVAVDEDIICIKNGNSNLSVPYENIESAKVMISFK